MPAWLLLSVAFAVGAAVMVVELMGVRLMAPWFGQSQLVWTNVIGVVLAALAVGQWLGGRWAEGQRGPSPAALLVFAGAIAAALPDLVNALAGALIPEDLRLIEAYPFVTLGSLLVAVVAVGWPLLALGAVTPWLVRLSRGVSKMPARVTGRLLAAGTLGSLVGTFGATHVLLGAFGSAWAVRGAGAVLILAGLALGRRRTSALGWLLVPLVAGLLAGSRERSTTVLEALETPYQFAFVDEDSLGVRRLRINEALDSFHSLTVPGQVLTGMYYDAFLVPALAAPASADGVKRVMIVGLGGGTMARQLRALAPEIAVEGIEIDAQLIRLGVDYLSLPPDVPVLAADGRTGLMAAGRSFGAILIDAYASQIYLPAHLCTLEFFELVAQRLLDGGVAVLNLGGLSVDDPVVAAVAGTFAHALDDVVLVCVPGTRNLMCLGWRGTAGDLAPISDRLADAGLAEALSWVFETERYVEVEPAAAGRVLRDGDAPVESLAHREWRSQG